MLEIQQKFNELEDSDENETRGSKGGD